MMIVVENLRTVGLEQEFPCLVSAPHCEMNSDELDKDILLPNHNT